MRRPRFTVIPAKAPLVRLLVLVLAALTVGGQLHLQQHRAAHAAAHLLTAGHEHAHHHHEGEGEAERDGAEEACTACQLAVGTGSLALPAIDARPLAQRPLAQPVPTVPAARLPRHTPVRAHGARGPPRG